MITENKEEEKSLQTLRSDMINIMQTMCKTLDEKTKKLCQTLSFYRIIIQHHSSYC